MIKFMLFQTYLERIKKSVGTTMFQNTFFEEDGKAIDVTQNGELCCAIYVSSILKKYDLVGELHINVKSTLEDTLRSGWFEIDGPRPGAVIYWEVQQKKSGPHAHMGFCLDEKNAVSHLDSSSPYQYPGCPNIHPLDSTDGKTKRKIEKILWHPKLDH